MKELQTIKDLCVSVVEKETEMLAMEKRGFSVEEKKAIVTSFKLLLGKAELRAAIRFCLEHMENAYDLASDGAIACGERCDWVPSKSSYYNVTNIILYCLDMKTFKQYKDNEEQLNYLDELVDEFDIPQNW